MERQSIEKDIDFQLNYFLNSNKNFYHLYITILSIFRSIYVHSVQCNDQNSKKFLKDETNLFYLKFSKNTFLKKLSFDKVLENQIVEFKIDIFEKHPEYLISLWKKIEESKLFSDYINNKDHSFLLSVLKDLKNKNYQYKW